MGPTPALEDEDLDEDGPADRPVVLDIRLQEFVKDMTPEELYAARLPDQLLADIDIPDVIWSRAVQRKKRHGTQHGTRQHWARPGWMRDLAKKWRSMSSSSLAEHMVPQRSKPKGAKFAESLRRNHLQGKRKREQSPGAPPGPPASSEPPAPKHEHEGLQVLITSLEARPEHYGHWGQVGKVHQGTGELQYWLMLETASKGNIQHAHVAQHLVTPVAQLQPGAERAPPALDFRTKDTKAWVERARSNSWGNDPPYVVVPAESGAYAEIRFMGVQVSELEHRVPVPSTTIFGPEACIQFQDSSSDQLGLVEAFVHQRVQMILWAPNHYGYLEFQVQPPPADWCEPYDPPKLFQIQFWDSLGGHEPLRQAAERIVQNVFDQGVLAHGVTACPDSCCSSSWQQKDGWSCGFHALRWAQLRRRQWRGETQSPMPTVSMVLQQANVVVTKLQEAQAAKLGVPPPGAPDHGAKGEGKGTPGDGATDKGTDPGVGEAPEGKPDDSRGLGRKKGITYEEAQRRAVMCGSCQPKKTGPYKGQKGCTRCMGEYFQSMRTRAKAKAKASS